MREPAASLEVLTCSAVGSCDQRATAPSAGSCLGGGARCRLKLRFDTTCGRLLHSPDHAKQCFATDLTSPSISADLKHAEGLSADMPSALTPMRPARVARPCIVATAVDPRHSTRGRQPELARLLAHESVPRRHPFWDESDSAHKQPSLTSQVSAGYSLSVPSNASGSPPAFISLRGEPHEQYSCNCLG